MAYEFYVKWDMTKQGKSKGESPREKRKDWVGGLSYFHEIKSPRDVATGQASGKRQHGPITITKEWGASTPQIFQALCTNEVIKTVEFEFMKTNANGEEYVYQTVKLTNATFSHVKYMTGAGAGEGANSSKHAGSHDTHELEAVSFSYQKIEIENKDGKTMAMDDWQAQG
ncbi:MAG: type VI secretion system tube protein Hcp [Candidatus Sumerlaeia bacterium]|nr:type VI secretion system tube protein Hcp [Candidatus Sumerlaeia bacterium]